jgi:hypothetical protein
MENIARSLRAQHPADRVYILVAKRNAGNFTYDGIETGGERVCGEIEEELQAIERRGGHITKLSVVGYSLGGLVARYAIGLLYAKGVMDRLECLNFTAFASPFLGARSPRKGTFGRIWNGVGANVLSASGRQLWGIDRFRDTGRPLLSVLADPDSIFMSGLRKFKRRTLYSNITNDRTAVFYTTYISKKDPFEDLDKVRCKFVKGFDDVILDPDDPFEFVDDVPTETFADAARRRLQYVPFVMLLCVFMPIGLSVLFVTSGIQSVLSPQRIQRHQKGLAGIDAAKYRVPLWIREMREAVGDAYERVDAAQPNEYLTPTPSPSSEEEDLLSLEASERGAAATSRTSTTLTREKSHAEEGPTLALAPEQFDMIESLDSLGWRKFPVWIHNDRHSHAAIILRRKKESHAEGKQVLRHWMQREFLS